MVSPEVLRRYPFFAGLSHEQLVTLAMMAEEQRAEAGHWFFREGEELESLYLVMEGQVAIIINITMPHVAQSVARQLTGQVETTGVAVSQVAAGETFGWTSITLARGATASAQAITPCQVIAFDRRQLLEAFDKDCKLGYLILQKVIQVAQQRLHDLRVESLAQVRT